MYIFILKIFESIFDRCKTVYYKSVNIIRIVNNTTFNVILKILHTMKLVHIHRCIQIYSILLFKLN